MSQSLINSQLNRFDAAPRAGAGGALAAHTGRTLLGQPRYVLPVSSRLIAPVLSAITPRQRLPTNKTAE